MLICTLELRLTSTTCFLLLPELHAGKGQSCKKPRLELLQIKQRKTDQASDRDRAQGIKVEGSLTH
jgi:hypothetical protein